MKSHRNSEFRHQNIFRILISFLIVSIIISGFNPFNSTNFHSTKAGGVNNRVILEQTDLINDSLWLPISRTLDSPIKVKNIQDYNQSIQTVEYDLRTKTEKRGVNNINLQSDQPFIEPFEGILEEDFENRQYLNSDNLKISYPFPPDDRERITNTTSYPWRTICKLFITAADDSQFIGSGFIVDEFHILTCGHCVYIHDNGGWVSELLIIPGMDEDYYPFAYAYAINFRTYTGWINNEDDEHDWALVTLDRCIGNYTGWMGIRTDVPSSSIYTGVLNLAGYPGDLDDGNVMYFDSDLGVSADQYNHYYWMDMSGGQSGSPVWQNDGGNLYVLSINAYEVEDGLGPNFGTRLNQDKFDQLKAWLAEDSPSSPDDKPDLLDRGYYSNISSYNVIPGKTNFKIICDVENDGTTTASSFNVSFYAFNLSISSTDYLIGSVIIDSLSPFNYTSANWSGIFPTNIPKGFYEIRGVIDVNDDIDEMFEDNNLIIDEDFKIYVEALKKPSLKSMILFILYAIVIPIGIILLIVAIAIVIIRKHKRTPNEVDLF